jgi:hypothetical protein
MLIFTFDMRKHLYACQFSHDETIDNKPVKYRVARHSGFRGTSWIQASVFHARSD